MEPLRCNFRTISQHETSLGWVRYQACSCGRLRVLLDRDPIHYRTDHVPFVDVGAWTSTPPKPEPSAT